VPAGTGAAEILRRIDAVTVDDVGQLAADPLYAGDQALTVMSPFRRSIISL
jgi:demethoxyubiquinone hydroxylase (CLK1/Coq7/Cat5 family)